MISHLHEVDGHWGKRLEAGGDRLFRVKANRHTSRYAPGRGAMGQMPDQKEETMRKIMGVLLAVVLVAGGLGGLAYAQDPSEGVPSLETHLLAVMPDGYSSPADLDGAKIRLPSSDSPWYGWAEVALDTYNITYEYYYVGWKDARAALMEGDCDAVLVPQHPPLFEWIPGDEEVRFLPWSSEAIEAVVEQFDAVPAYLPANTYPWQTEPVPGYAPAIDDDDDIEDDDDDTEDDD